MCILLEAEIKWVEEHPLKYLNRSHQDSVIRNISNRYLIRKLRKEIDNLKGEQ